MESNSAKIICVFSDAYIPANMARVTTRVPRRPASPETAQAKCRTGVCLMIKSELIQRIADENPHLFQRDVERIVATIFDEIIDAMANGNRVELRGFGAFSVKMRQSRQGRNPRTGETVEVEEKYVPFFKTGKLLRDRLNDRS